MTAPANIYQALSKVMESVQSISKDSRNATQNFNFRGIDAVVNAVGPALREQGVIVVPDLREYLYGTVEVGKARTPMSHARVTVAYTFHAPDGSSLTAVAPGEAMDSGDKATPKAMSVAFRTALLQALCVPTDDPDPDAHVFERSSAPEMSTPEVRDAIRDLGRQRAVGDLRGFVQDTIRREVLALTDLTADEGSAVMARLISMADLAPAAAVEEQQAEIRQLRDELHEARGDVAQPEPVRRPAAPPKKISQDQIGKIMAMFTRLEILDRAERLEYCGVVIGRPITSSFDMTMREASKLIDHLEGIESPIEAAGAVAGEGAIETEVISPIRSARAASPADHDGSSMLPLSSDGSRSRSLSSTEPPDRRSGLAEGKPQARPAPIDPGLYGPVNPKENTHGLPDPRPRRDPDPSVR